MLLTGHTGFKGAWLTLWLLQLGAQVHGLALDPDTTPNLFDDLGLAAGPPAGLSGCLHHHRCDLRQPEAVTEVVLRARPQVVLHLAAQSLVRRSYREPLATWAVNVMGSLHLLEALALLEQPCAAVMVTTDKVYENREWCYGYRETDRLGGRDPYSASKAAAELAIASWRASFCGPAAHQTPHLTIATARAGNVIGGGDWAPDRIVPDAMRAWAAGTELSLRNPRATRPWQHVLEPLGGYLLLAQTLAQTPHASMACAWNFGPTLEANRPVVELVEALHGQWPGQWRVQPQLDAPHEAGLLHLVVDQAHHRLGWWPRWDFATTVARTARWYRRVHEGAAPLACCLDDLRAYDAF